MRSISAKMPKPTESCHTPSFASKKELGGQQTRPRIAPGAVLQHPSAQKGRDKHPDKFGGQSRGHRGDALSRAAPPRAGCPAVCLSVRSAARTRQRLPRAEGTASPQRRRRKKGEAREGEEEEEAITRVLFPFLLSGPRKTPLMLRKCPLLRCAELMTM